MFQAWLVVLYVIGQIWLRLLTKKTAVFASFPVDVACKHIHYLPDSQKLLTLLPECQSIGHGLCSIVASHDHNFKVRNRTHEPILLKLIISIRDSSQHASLQAEIEDQSTALYSTARLWDDGIIKPTDTRDVVGLGLALASRRSPLHSDRFLTTWDGSKQGFGVFRM